MKNTNMRTMEYLMLVGFIFLDNAYNRCESGVVITTTPTEEDEFTTTEPHIGGADTESETTTTEFEAETIPATESSHTEYTTYESEVETTPGSSEVPSTAENSELQSTTENSEIQSTTENSEIQSTTENSEIQSTVENSESQSTTENSEIPTTAENPELQSTTTEHSEHVVLSTEDSSDTVITEASSDTITSEDSTDAGMVTTTEPSPILSRTESPDPDLVDCCEWDGCEDKLGINSYCRFHDYSNSTYCDDRNSPRRKKREVVVQTTVSTTEFPGKPGKCWCRLGFHILRRNGPCVSIGKTSLVVNSAKARDVFRYNKFCYNWTCVGQNCSLQVTEQNITCQRTGPNCWVTKMCLLTETEYMFSCTDPCNSVQSSPSVDCYSVPCTASICNSQTSSVDNYTCFSSDGCCVSITRIMIGVVFIVTNVWIYIAPL